MDPDREGKAHRAPYTAVLIALVVFTALEVGASYLAPAVRLPILIVLAVTKAALVVLFFMHLKYDVRIYAVMFILGLVLVTPLLLFIGLATPLASPNILP